NEIIAFVGEFCGTFSFLFMGFTALQIANSAIPVKVDFPSTINLLFISSAFGTSLAVNVWVFFRISGGLFNPAVSIHIPHLTCTLLIENLKGDTSPIVSWCNKARACDSRLRCTDCGRHRGSCSG